MGRTEIQTVHSHMPLQGPKCCIPLEWACCSFFAVAMSLLTENHRFVQWVGSPRLIKRGEPTHCS